MTMLFRPTASTTDTAAALRRTGVLAVAIAAASGAAIGGLSITFDFPAVLTRPGSEVLRMFTEHRGPVMLWYTVFVLAAAALAPLAVGVSQAVRSRGVRVGGWVTALGIGAAATQLSGFQRWLTLVPGLTDRYAAGDPTAASTQDTLNLWLGHVVGEQLGDLLNASWAVAAAVLLARAGLIGRRLANWGVVSAVAFEVFELAQAVSPAAQVAGILFGVADAAWLSWLVVTGVTLVRHARLEP